MRKFWQKKYISKYTGKEIDDAVAKAGTALQNPMTAAGDIIVGGTDGEPEKLVKGTDGKVLKMVSGAPAWADDAGGMENPMTTAGDLIVGGEAGAAGRLAKGTDGQVLSMVSGSPAWAAAQGGDHLYWHSVTISSTTFTIMIAILNNSETPLTKTTLAAAMPVSKHFLAHGGGAVNATYDFQSTSNYNANIIPAAYVSKENYGGQIDYLVIRGVALGNSNVIYTNNNILMAEIKTLQYTDATLYVNDVVDQII